MKKCICAVAAVVAILTTFGAVSPTEARDVQARDTGWGGTR